MTLQTRQPTGLPSWPIALIAGVEGSGKSWKVVEASASPLIHRTLWIGCGEDDPDEYGILPGARHEIVLHDGTYRGILAAADAATAEPVGPNGEPNLIVLDSGSRFWEQIKDGAQDTANDRLIRKARRNNRDAAVPDDGATISPDLWNLARDRWYHVLNTLRAYPGPSIITSRLKITTVFENGEPTKEKMWDQKSQFDLPYDVGLYVQMRAPFPQRDDWLIRVKSARFQHPVDDQGQPRATALSADWSFENLWRQLGLGVANQPVGDRSHQPVVSTGGFDAEDARRTVLLEELKAAAEAAKVPLADIAADWAASHNGQPIKETSDFGALELLRDDLNARKDTAA
jgi:hypothetical protein